MVYELTPEQDKWLEEVFKPTMHLTIRGQVLTNYYEAEKIFTGANRHLTRGCSCELGGLKTKVVDLYNRYETKKKEALSRPDRDMVSTDSQKE
jgi:hypothetical protein